MARGGSVNPETRKELDSCLAEVIADIVKNPAVFVSETDIHVLVMSKLLGLPCLSGRYATAATIGGNRQGSASPATYETMLVHKEYGHEGIGWARSDVVVFDPEDVARIDDPLNLTANDKYLQPRFILEFGTEKAASSKAVLQTHMEDDVQKLLGAGEAGYLIHLHRWLAHSPCGERYDGHRQRIRDFEKVVERFWAAVPSASKQRIVPLVVFVKFGVEERYTKSKYRLFYPRLWHFKNVNEKDISARIHSVLSGTS
jgi:hypothetical protein